MDFSERVKQATDIYDIMAAAYHEILPYAPKKRRDCAPLKDTSIRGHVLVCAEERHRSGVAALGSFKRYLLENCLGAGYSFFLEIIDSIDKAYPYEFETEDVAIEAFKSVPSLTRDPELLILPVFANLLNEKLDVKLMADKRHHGWLRGRKMFKATFNSNMRNYLIYEKNEFDYEIKTLQLTDRRTMSRAIKARGTYNVAFFPVTSRALIRILDMSFEENTFTVNDMRPGQVDYITERYIEALDKMAASDEHVDVAIFPEMVFSEPVYERVKAHIRQLRADRLPTIIVLGSYWKDARNRCVVVNDAGQEYYQQDKHTPFVISRTGQEEALSLEHNEVYLIDVEGLGRFITPICKDLDNQSIQEVIKALHCHQVLCPSFSSSRDINASAKDLANEFHVYSFICNACSSYCGEGDDVVPVGKIHSKDEIGYACLPGKQESVRLEHTLPYCFRSQCHECESACNGHMLTLNFGELDPDAGKNIYWQAAKFT